MKDGQKTDDLHGLDERYEVLGELRGNGAVRTYVGKMRNPSAEVAIMVARTTGQNNDLSHLASDTRMLVNVSHPGLIHVIDGCWLGTTGFAVVTDRIRGDSLGERLERGEKFTSPRIAAILEDVKAVLDWAREKGVVHRGVTPDTLILDPDSDRVKVSFAPTPIPLNGVPDIATDARTIGMLAWAMYVGKSYGGSEKAVPLAELAPNLAKRVQDATTRMISAKDYTDAPDITTYIATVAAADVLKQAEVELAAMKEDYDEEHRRELQKCEMRRQETEQHASEQASILAGEREDFERMMSDERAAMAAERTAIASERAEFDRLMKERKDRLAAVRAELDQQRAALERRLTELEEYRKEVDKVRREAIAAADAAAAATAASAAAAAQASTLATTPETAQRTTPKTTPALKQPTTPVAVPVLPGLPVPPPHLKKPAKTNWDRFDAIDRDESDMVPTIGEGRPRWLIPAGVAALLLIVIAGMYSLTHRNTAQNTIKLGDQTIVPTAPAVAPGITPRGGFLTQAAGGTLSPRFGATSTPFTRTDSAATASATTASGTAANPLFDSTHATHAMADSAARAAATAETPARRAERDAAARRRAARDSARAASAFDPTNPTPRALPPAPDTSSVNRDTVVRPAIRDSVRPKADTTRPRPDTTRPRPDTLSRAM